MRTEQEVLKDFEDLGYEVVCNNNLRIKLENNGEIIAISKYSCWYSSKRYDEYNKYEGISVPIGMKEHKLLNELFTIWGWL